MDPVVFALREDLSPLIVTILTRLAYANPLEAHLSRAMVVQQGPEEQPARASIGPCVRVKIGGVGP